MNPARPTRVLGRMRRVLRYFGDLMARIGATSVRILDMNRNQRTELEATMQVGARRALEHSDAKVPPPASRTTLARFQTLTRWSVAVVAGCRRRLSSCSRWSNTSIESTP